VLTRGFVNGEIIPRDFIAVLSSTSATVLIAVFAASRLTAWRRDGLDSPARWLLVALAVIGANAAISFPYTKTVIMSPAGVFYALAAGLAFSWALSRVGSQPRAAHALVALVLAAIAAGWTLRFVGLHYRLREKAFITRNEWTEVIIGQGQADIDPVAYPEAAALIERLRRDALTLRAANPAFNPPNVDRYIEEAW
jgi:hypothetical protein